MSMIHIAGSIADNKQACRDCGRELSFRLADGNLGWWVEGHRVTESGAFMEDIDNHPPCVAAKTSKGKCLLPNGGAVCSEAGKKP